MADIYNLTCVQNGETIADLVVCANDAYPIGLTSPQILVGGFMFVIFILLLMALRKYQVENSLAVSSFVCFILSAILNSGNLIRFEVTLFFLIILAATMLYSFTVKR